MFDKYMIVGEVFKNIVKNGEITGYQLGVRLPYYRGVVLSLIGDIELTVNGEIVPSDQISVTVAGNTLPLCKIADEPVLKWEFGEIGILTVEKPGGLKLGDIHIVNLQIHMDISYIPGGFVGRDCKELLLTE